MLWIYPVLQGLLIDKFCGAAVFLSKSEQYGIHYWDLHWAVAWQKSDACWEIKRIMQPFLHCGPSQGEIPARLPPALPAKQPAFVIEIAFEFSELAYGSSCTIHFLVQPKGFFFQKEPAWFSRWQCQQESLLDIVRDNMDALKVFPMQMHLSQSVIKTQSRTRGLCGIYALHLYGY